MEHKFENIQTAFGFSATFALRAIPNGEQTKMKMERGIILVRKFVFKVINNERNILTHYEIVDRIVKQVKKYCRTFTVI